MSKVAKPCLKHGERCHYLGTLGSCCSINCKQDAAEDFGVCVGDSPPTGLPSKCLANEAECHQNLTTGLCCSEFCFILAPHTVGICRDRIRTEPKTAKQKWIVGTGIALPIAVVVLGAFLWLYWKQKKLERILSQSETHDFFYGNPEVAHLNGYAHENADCLPYNKDKWEISDSAFTIDWSSPLGSGCFGLVLRAKVRNEDVAVKTVKMTNTESASHVRSLLSEIKVLQYIGTHDNIVNMVGSNTSNLQNGKVFLFLEFCPLGSLEKYLRAHKSSFRPESHPQSSLALSNEIEKSGNIYMETEMTDSSLSTSHLLNWCIQITQAMKYLESKKVIHADLAARNVLLVRKDCAKLTDFGLSRRLYEYTSYVKKHQEPLPWRHMALESLKQLTFTHQSDVWSLGILFWEIFSFGDVPYPGIVWTPDFIQNLEKNNMRPLKPEAASNEMFDLMHNCWKLNPEERPNFEKIHERLWKLKEGREIVQIN